MKYLFKLMVIAGALITLAGCATQSVQLSPKFWQNHKQKVFVANNKIPKAGLYQAGQEGLLDFAVNDIVTNKFQAYLKKYPTKSLGKIKDVFLQKLRAHHIHTKMYSRQIDTDKLADYSGNANKFATKNYTPFAAKIGPHKLLIVSVKSIGAIRPYYGFIPLGDPKAVCSLEGRLVDLQNNKILWRYPVNVVIAVQGKWDQPPNYPNFTAALHRAVRSARQQLLDGFFITK